MSKRCMRKRAAASTSSSDDENPPAPAKNKLTSNAPTKSVMLSFGDQDSGESDNDFVVKKSKASRTFKKKIRQAPNASSVEGTGHSAMTQVAPSIAGAGGQYSAENLAALRSEQRFSTAVVPAVPVLDDVELAGDEAMWAEDNLILESNNVESTITDDCRDKLDKIKDSRSIEDKKKVKFASAIPKNDQRDFNALNDAESTTWEEQLLKRVGHIGKPSADASKFSKESETKFSSKFEEITFEDSLSSLQGGIDKLENTCESNRTKLANLNNTYAASLKEQEDLKSAVESMQIVQEWMEDFRLYCSDVVGMVREKSETIHELGEAIIQVHADELKSLASKRAEEQELCVLRIREAGQLLSLGGYAPLTNCLMQANGQPQLNCSCANLAISHIVGLLEKGLHGEEVHLSIIKLLKSLGGTSEIDLRSIRRDNVKICSLRSAAQLLMSDVREDIAVSTILNMFSRLRQGYPSRYRSAFISMSLPPLLGELVKLDMIALPLPYKSISLDERPWHDPLYQYSTGTVAEANMASDAASDTDDSVLLPKVVYGAVFPWILSMVQRAFDPSSEDASTAISDILSQLLEYEIPTGELNALLRLILSKFEKCLDSFCVPNLRSNADFSSHKFLIHQLWDVNMCLENLLRFKGLLSSVAITNCIWDRFVSSWCSAISTFLTFVSTQYQEAETAMECLLGIYVCLRLVITICRTLQSGEHILNVLYSQKNLGRTDDAVVNATYFLQIRELVARLKPEYELINIPVDAVISVTQASLVLLANLESYLLDDKRNGNITHEIVLLSNVIRRLTS